MLNTKDIKTGGTGVPKTLQPGNYKVKIHRVELEDFRFKPGALHVLLHVEGEPMDEDFDGFWINKDDHSLGKYKGQVGRIKAGEYAFADGETKSGIPVSRDQGILKFLKNICTETGCTKWLDDQDGKHATIQSLVEAFANEKPFKDKWLSVCLAGKEYTNKEGYASFDLFFPKYAKDGAPFVSAEKSRNKVITFDPNAHIKKQAVQEVKSFGSDEGISDSAKNDFVL